MNPSPHRRWDFRVLATRWIHVLWLLPLLGAIGGNWIHSSELANTRTGVVQLQAETLTFAPGTCVSSDEGAVHPVLSSPELLQAVISKLGLQSSWKLSHTDCFARLRGMLHCRRIDGTALTEVSVRASDPGESAIICHSVLEELRQSLSMGASEDHALRLAWAREAVFHQQDFVKRKRAELSEMMRLDSYPPHRISITKTTFEEAQRELENLKIHELRLELEKKVLEEPVIIHEWPSAAPPLSRRSALTSSLLHHLTLGYLAGILLAVALIYPLEHLFPREKDSEKRFLDPSP